MFISICVQGRRPAVPPFHLLFCVFSYNYFIDELPQPAGCIDWLSGVTQHGTAQDLRNPASLLLVLLVSGC